MLNVVVLAAGKGTRMNSALPKVLHTIGGQSMLAHVIEAARALNPARIIVVVGHDAERVQSRFADQSDLHFVLQEPQERSEEHTSELQSRGHLVCRLLL